MDTPHPDKIERLLPALVWAETNLDSDLSLNTLAEVAGLSPHHFHRLFRESVGETTKRYVQRLRLDRGAFLLSIVDRSVLEIALEVGYQNHETFSRAFKRRFNKTPSAYRRSSHSEASKERPGRMEGLEQTRNVGELSATCIRKFKDIHVAFIRHLGDYKVVPPILWDELMEWPALASLDRDCVLLGIGHDAPGITPTEKLRFDACVQVPEPFTPEGRIGYQMIPGGYYAMTTHVGPYSTLPAAWGEVFGRVMALKVYDTPMLPVIEMYHTTQINPKFALNRTELCMPLKKRG